MTDQKPFPPVFATNNPATGETVAAEVNRMLAGLRTQLASPPNLALATAYINPQGFALIADEVEGKITRKGMADDARNPLPGTKLVREWSGTEHTVTVLADGYDLAGRKFKSLSAVAKAITGPSWNGFRFFGLRDKQRSGA